MLNKWFNWWWNFILLINWCFVIKYLGIKKCLIVKEIVFFRDVNFLFSKLMVLMVRFNIYVGIVICIFGFV